MIRRILCFLVIAGACSAQETKPCAPRPILKATMSDDGDMSFSLTCPKGWHVQMEQKASEEFNNKKERNSADAVNLLANHSMCVAGDLPRKEKP